MIFAGCMRSVGKQAIDESGKHRVNGDDEGTLAPWDCGDMAAK